MRSVVLVQFATADGAAAALERVTNLGEHGVTVRTAAAVRCDHAGWAVIRRFAPPPFGGTFIGGLLGALVGACWGLGPMALAGCAGLVGGALADLLAMTERTAVLATLAARVPSGWAAVVADLEEVGPGPLEAAMRPLAGDVSRFDRWALRAAMAAGAEPPVAGI